MMFFFLVKNLWKVQCRIHPPESVLRGTNFCKSFEVYLDQLFTSTDWNVFSLFITKNSSSSVRLDGEGLWAPLFRSFTDSWLDLALDPFGRHQLSNGSVCEQEETWWYLLTSSPRSRFISHWFFWAIWSNWLSSCYCIIKARFMQRSTSSCPVACRFRWMTESW